MVIQNDLRNLYLEITEGTESLQRWREWAEALDKAFTRVEPSVPDELVQQEGKE